MECFGSVNLHRIKSQENVNTLLSIKVHLYANQH